MREDLEKLKELKYDLIACAMNIEAAHKELYIINHDYQILKEIQEDLIYNIEYLKKDKIVAVVKEYQKSVETLERVVMQLDYLNIQYKITLRELVKLEQIQSEAEQRYEAQKEYCDNYRVVLPFDLSRKKVKDEE